MREAQREINCNRKLQRKIREGQRTGGSRKRQGAKGGRGRGWGPASEFLALSLYYP